MLWFSFDDFYKKFEDDYTGKQERKSKLVDAIKLIQKQKCLKSQLKTLDALLEEIKPLVFENPDDIDSKHNWHNDNANLIKSFNHGDGSSYKAAACHYLFLTKPAYKDAADIMNEALFPGKTLEDVFPKKVEQNEAPEDSDQPSASFNNLSNKSTENDNIQTTSGSSQTIPLVWQLICIDDGKRTVDPHFWSFGLDDRKQCPSLNGTLGIFAEVFMASVPCDRGYSYGFREARISIFEAPEAGQKLRFSTLYKQKQEVGNNVVARIDGTAPRIFLEIIATSKSLSGKYECNHGEFIYVTPGEQEYEFEADLSVSVCDMNLIKSDGFPLPSSENKKAIIKSLLCEFHEDVPIKRERLVLSRQKFLIKAVPLTAVIQ